MASAGGRARPTDEIREVEMEIVDLPLEEPGRVGSKRTRDSSDGWGSYGSKYGSQVQDLPNLKVAQFKDSSKDELCRNLVHSFGDYNGKGLSDSYFPRTYLDRNTLSDHQYRSFGLPMSSDHFQHSEKLPAYGGITDYLPNMQPKEHLSNHASYSSHGVPGSRNPGYATSDHSFGSPILQTTSSHGIVSRHLCVPDIEKFYIHKPVDVDKGRDGSKRELLGTSSPDPSTVSAGPLRPIKDEIWETSVPFVASFDYPCIKTPSSLYDPFVDGIEPKVENTINLKSSNISCSVSTQHTDQCILADKSLNLDNKLTRNMSTRGSTERMDDNNRVKACDRKNIAASDSERTKEFRFLLAEHVKELLKPIWKEGFLSKDAHKLVVKRTVDKVLSAVEPHQIATKELMTKYLTSFGPKIEKLMKAYVDVHSKA